MADVVRGQVRLDPICVRCVVPHSHNACVVNEDVDLLNHLLNRSCRLPDRVEFIELDWHKGHFVVFIHFCDVCYDRVDFVLAAGQEHDMRRIAMGEGDRRCCAESLHTSSGDQDWHFSGTVAPALSRVLTCLALDILFEIFYHFDSFAVFCESGHHLKCDLNNTLRRISWQKKM